MTASLQVPTISKLSQSASLAAATPTSRGPSALICFLVLRDTGKTTRILFSFPLPGSKVNAQFPKLSQFCFPNALGCDDMFLQYTFVLTDKDGNKIYGHTLQAVNGDAYVCLSPYPWCGFFAHLAHLYRTNGAENGNRMIKLFYESTLDGVPAAGAAFSVPLGGRKLYRPMDHISAYIDTSPLFLLQLFTVDQLFEILGSLLTEKHVVVIGSSFGLVSTTMMSLLAILAPFEWQHTMVPVLPTELIEVFAAPTPYFMGLVDSQASLLENVAIEGLVVVRLGRNVSDDPKKAKVACQGIEYFNESKIVLPRTGKTSRIRWQLQIMKMSLGSRDVLGGADQYSPESPTGRSSASHSSFSSGGSMLLVSHRELCEVFLEYYAQWLGPAVACRLELSSPVAPAAAVVAEPLAGLQLQHPSEKPFFELLVRSQAFTEVIGRCKQLLSGAELTPSHNITSEVSIWQESVFLVTMVRSHAHLFPEHMSQLRAAVATSAADKYRVDKKDTVGRKSSAASISNSMQTRVGVRSLLCRTFRCCALSRDEVDDDDEELRSKPPGSS